jgi:Ni/Co efflux regulator RcnB
MTLKKLITSAAVSAIAAGSLVPLSSAASANEWNHHGGRHTQRFERNFDNGHRETNRWGERNEHRQHNAWRGGDHDEGGYRRHRDHTGRYLALGAFATILGIALASQQSRVQHDYYDEN